MAKKTLPDSAAVEKKRAAGREYSRTHRAQANAWKAANRDKINAAEREARKNNPEIFRASVARYMASEKGKAARLAYYEANVEDFKRRAKQAAEANPDRVLANKRAYYEANKAEIKQRVREWNAANPEATRARGRNYRARSRGAEGSHSAEDIKALYTQQAGICVYCSAVLGDAYHVDHIRALARGGFNWPDNLQLTCGPCNISKRAIDHDEYLRRLSNQET